MCGTDSGGFSVGWDSKGLREVTDGIGGCRQEPRAPAWQLQLRYSVLVRVEMLLATGEYGVLLLRTTISNYTKYSYDS